MADSTNSGENLRNVKRAFDDYVYRYLDVSEGLSVDYPGMPFDDTPESEWIMPRIVGIEREFVRQSSSTQFAFDTDIEFQVGIFVKKSGVTTSIRTAVLRDTVADYFKIGQDITLYNYLVDPNPGGYPLLTAGYFPPTYFARGYWIDRYWVRGTATSSDSGSISGATALATMRVRELMEDMPQDEEQTLYEHLISWKVNFTEMYEAP